MSNNLTETPKPLVDPSWCGKCQKLVMKVGKGRCPICGGFTTGHTERLRERADEARVELILTGLMREFGEPQTETERSLYRTLARVMAALEKATPGKIEHKNLVVDKLALTEALREICKQRDEQPKTDLSHLPLAELLERSIELHRQRLGILEAELQEERMSSNHPSPKNAPIPEQNPPVSEGATEVQPDPGVDHVTTTDEKLVDDPPKVATCPWCKQTPCVGRAHHSYDVMHAQDPEHVAKRRDYHTREMFESLRRQQRGTY